MKIHVLGLGESLSKYVADGSKTIGCNDIWNYVQTDYVVCVDKPTCFSNEPERMKGIINGKQEKFFTHVKEWEGLVSNYSPIVLSKLRSDLSKLDSEVPHSNNSAFVACVMAYKLGAKLIVMSGVDLKSHHKLGQDGVMKHAIRDFRNLQIELFSRGVELRVSSRVSALAEHLGVSQ